MKKYLHRCPKCRSTNFHIYKHPTSPISCKRCSYSVPDASKYKTFTEIIGGDVVKIGLLYDFTPSKSEYDFTNDMTNQREVLYEIESDDIIYVFPTFGNIDIIHSGIKCKIKKIDTQGFYVIESNNQTFLLKENLS